jgi:hypothetical protein
MLAGACGSGFTSEPSPAGNGGVAGTSGAGTGASAATGGGGAAGSGAGASGVGASGGYGASGGVGATGGAGGNGGTPGNGGAAGTSAGGSDGGTGSPCDQQYGSVQFYKLCTESATACNFIAANKVESCGIVCKNEGGECLGAYDNVDGDPTCGKSTVVDCNYVGWYEIVCVCSKGCGTGQACTYPKFCSGGQCS